jgi:hypothetical protein
MQFFSELPSFRPTVEAIRETGDFRFASTDESLPLRQMVRNETGKWLDNRWAIIILTEKIKGEGWIFEKGTLFAYSTPDMPLWCYIP